MQNEDENEKRKKEFVRRILCIERYENRIINLSFIQNDTTIIFFRDEKKH